MRYLDSSAIIKLIYREDHSEELHQLLASSRVPLLTSSIGFVEIGRFLQRRQADAATLETATRILGKFTRVELTDAVMDQAVALPVRHLPTLGAIHLASAQQLGDALTSFVAYDKRLVEAARAERLPVETPGTTI